MDNIDGKVAFDLYTKTSASMQAIASEWGKTKQWISQIIRRYIKDNDIKFILETRYLCKICDSAKTTRVAEHPKLCRKELVRIVEKKTTCEYCVANYQRRCHKCDKVGHENEFVRHGGSWNCMKCEKLLNIRWMDKNRKKWNEYQKQYRRKKDNG